jgi:hypothetical protein
VRHGPGSGSSMAAMDAIPALRAAVAQASRRAGAIASGVGQSAFLVPHRDHPGRRGAPRAVELVALAAVPVFRQRRGATDTEADERVTAEPLRPTHCADPAPGIALPAPTPQPRPGRTPNPRVVITHGWWATSG